MKKLILAFSVLVVIISLAACNKKEEDKLVFAYFSGYRCSWCRVFEEAFLNDFEKTYKDKYNGRVELKIYKVDVPLHMTKDSPEYKEAQKLADRNMAILTATGKLNGAKWIGSMPYVVVGHSALDGSSDEADFTKENAQRALNKALENKEVTKLANSASGKMADYKDINDAAKTGDYKAVQAFLKKGVSPSEKEENTANTPLMLSVFEGNKDVVNLLLSKGADVNAVNDWGGTALGSALFMGRPEIADLLISKGAKITTKGIIDAGVDEEMIKLLKKHGADINGTIDNGNTPLTDVLIRRENSFGPKISINYAEILIRQGADVNKKVTIKDDNGKTITRTPLQLAKSKEMKDFLISKGAK